VWTLEDQEDDFNDLSNLKFCSYPALLSINNSYYRKDEIMISGKVIVSVVIGAAVGTVFGVLYAPAKGSVTRKRIARRSTACAKDVNEKFNDYIDAIAEEYKTIKESAMVLVHKGK
jgi:hypothetical protein